MVAGAGNIVYASDMNVLSTKLVSSTAGGTGVTTTETKDATGDLQFTAISGVTYLVNYLATGRAGATGHYMDVNIRDGGASSPSSASTNLGGVTVGLPATALTAPVAFMKPLRCPTDIAAGTHTIAIFYVRNASGATTNVVQLEVAGTSRVLSVTATPTRS